MQEKKCMRTKAACKTSKIYIDIYYTYICLALHLKVYLSWCVMYRPVRSVNTFRIPKVAVVKCRVFPTVKEGRGNEHFYDLWNLTSCISNLFKNGS